MALARSSELIKNVIYKAEQQDAYSGRVPVYTGEFWTARQRQMHPLHYSVSYRASFKPELPDFFIQRLLSNINGPLVMLDPFGGRGTTILQANLRGHIGYYNDRNPVSGFLARARQHIPDLKQIEERLQQIKLDPTDDSLRTVADDERLLPFFHPGTLNEILQLRRELLQDKNRKDAALQYIGLAALSRLHGHSGGFFSVYSFPQISILPARQALSNQKRNQQPEYRPIRPRIWKKICADLSKPLPARYNSLAAQNAYWQDDARHLKQCPAGVVDLIVTSPPFLDKVNYYDDNWMRSWFLGREGQISKQDLTMTPHLDEWLRFMQSVMQEMGRVLKPGACAVIEVGEVVYRNSVIHLEKELAGMLPLKVTGGHLEASEIFIHTQEFTKLANCWDVSNNSKGTNTNRCLVIRKL
ncbi:MAG: site-specific DNA-methyltransferase [Leptospiraceae bacterium]|nr:site-specific DNA-methyltransferase [Leptospiraceae bacterium]